MEEAYNIFSEDARPEALISEISREEFDSVFEGEGKNADDAVLKGIYPEADHLALFALTMGEQVSSKIEHFFESHDYALASMLDSVASIAADTASVFLEKYYFDFLKSNKSLKDDSVVLSYSPGYCGWDITGQKKLFAYLDPAKIGIKINKSCLMSPIKSVSGLLVAGDREIHIFQMGFSYCDLCKTQSCQERISALY
jgi:hypothetical protein